MKVVKVLMHMVEHKFLKYLIINILDLTKLVSDISFMPSMIVLAPLHSFRYDNCVDEIHSIVD